MLAKYDDRRSTQKDIHTQDTDRESGRNDKTERNKAHMTELARLSQKHIMHIHVVERS